jgi:Cof subfamily protein (haloacid dehalogenase superfamily)
MALVPLLARPRLIALDLDGTVVDNSNEVPEPTLAQLRACAGMGIELAFLSGRRPRTATKHLDRIGLRSFVATNSGCLLWRYPGWVQLARRAFPPDLVQPIAELLIPYSANFYVDGMRHGFEYYYLDRQPSPVLDLYLKRWGFEARRIADPEEMDRYEITQVAVHASEQEVLRLRDEVRTRFGGRVLALAVRWPLLDELVLELFHPQANKGSALAFFADQLGLGPSDCLAVGDDVNDLAMLRWAGWGVAMPGATVEVRAGADETLAGDGPQALALLLEKVLAMPVPEH